MRALVFPPNADLFPEEQSRRLTQEDVELLRDHLPSGNMLRSDLETGLSTIPLASDADAVGVGLTLYNRDYGVLRDALRAIRGSGIEMSVELTKLHAALEAILDNADRAAVEKQLRGD
jgi:hypothetical protein